MGIATRPGLTVAKPRRSKVNLVHLAVPDVSDSSTRSKMGNFGHRSKLARASRPETSLAP